MGGFLFPMGWLADAYRQVITSEATTPRAVGSLFEARRAVAEERGFCMAASRLWQDVAKAQGYLASSVCTPVLSTSIVVRLPEPLGGAAPPVVLGADLAPVLGLYDHFVVEDLIVFDGSQGAS